MNLLVLRFLTLNAEDERRGELQAAAAAQNAVYLEGGALLLLCHTKNESVSEFVSSFAEELFGTTVEM
jgi:hypothetical protein